MWSIELATILANSSFLLFTCIPTQCGHCLVFSNTSVSFCLVCTKVVKVVLIAELHTKLLRRHFPFYPLIPFLWRHINLEMTFHKMSSENKHNIHLKQSKLVWNIFCHLENIFQSDALWPSAVYAEQCIFPLSSDAYTQGAGRREKK